MKGADARMNEDRDCGRRTWWRRGAVLAILCSALLAPTADRGAPSERTPAHSAHVRRPTSLAALAAPRAPVSPVAVAQPWPEVSPVAGPRAGEEIARGELLVTPADGATSALEERLREVLPIVALERLATLGAVRVRVSDALPLEQAIERVAALEQVETVTPNAIARGTGGGEARRASQRAFWNLEHCGLPQPAGSLASRSRVVVALLDSGIASASPGLSGVEIVAPLDTVDGDLDPEDENAHGTFLANLLVGSPGIARGVALMPVRVLDDWLVGTEASLIAGLHHAVLHGADVVNMSLVFASGYRPTRLLDATIADALASDVILVGAAGNGAEDHVRFPAALPGVIAVGASTLDRPERLTRALYSNWGAALDLLAPGGDLTADVNRDGLVDGVVAESFDPMNPASFGPWLYAGTSQAALHVSAAAALLLANGRAPSEVHAALRQGATDDARLGSHGFDVQTGSGHLDIARALTTSVRPASSGVQVVPVLRTERDGLSLELLVTVVDRDAMPIVRAQVHARAWGAIASSASCETDRRGVCALDVGLLESGSDVAVLAIDAVVLRDGRVSRPRTIATTLEMDGSRAGTGGTGFGPSSILWSVDTSFATSFWANATRTWMMVGSGEGSALPPTVIVVGDLSASLLLSLGSPTGGTGFGPSSIVFRGLSWSGSYFLGGFSIGGAGFGPSSIVWSGWTFMWPSLSYGGLYGSGITGSPVHELAGAALGGSTVAAADASVPR